MDILIGEKSCMDTSLNENKIYFDCNATTPTLKEACEAAICSMRKIYGNPSSPHLAGLEAKTVLERSRKTAAELIHADAQEIYFTSGATESIQIAVISFLKDYSQQKKQNELLPSKILVAATEHKAVSQSLKHWISLLNLDLSIVDVAVDKSGCVNLEDLKSHIKEAAFVCTMAVNNETGAIHPLKEIEKIIRSQNHPILWLVDCVQALGKIDLNLSALSIDYATFSGHKIYAPKGIGFLFVRESAPKCPFIVGGGQEQGLRSGTENLPGVAAIGVVLDVLNKRKKKESHPAFRSEEELAEFQAILIKALKATFPNIMFNTDVEKSVSTTINFSVPGFVSSELMRIFDAVNMQVSGGSACNSKTNSYSHVLVAMNLEPWRCANAVRMSFGLATTKEEVLQAEKAIYAAGLALKKACLHLSCQLPMLQNNVETNLHGLLQFNLEASNTWVLYDQNTNSCIIIDPTEENSERVFSFIQCRNIQVDAILDTHSHADHESSRKMYVEKLNLKDNAKNFLGWPSENDFLNFNSNAWIVQQIATPGHTLDTICYLVFEKNQFQQKGISFPKMAFVGDTILSGGLGRTDFGISGIEQFYTSLQQMNKILSPKTLLCPAHDYDNSMATTWETELKRNELLRNAVNEFNPMAFQEFCRQKKALDSQLESKFIHGKIVCGLIDYNCQTKSQEPIASFDILLQNDIIAIDVRDEAEYLLYANSNFFNLSTPPINIPINRFANYISHLLKEKELIKNKKIILLCSTGARSLVAAKSLRRLGFDNVWSIDGGFVFAALQKDEKNFFAQSQFV